MSHSFRFPWLISSRTSSIMPLPPRALIAVLLLTTGACSGGERDQQTPDSLGAASGGQRLGTGSIFTGDEGGTSISRIDMQSGQVAARDVGIKPHNVQVARDGRLLLAVGPVATDTMPATAVPRAGREPGAMEEMADGPGRLVILDADSFGDGQLIAIEIGRAPAHVVVDAGTRLAYTTNAADNSVIVVDVGQRRVVDTIATGASPHGLRLSPDGGDLYVAATGENSVSVIDTRSASEVARIPVGRAPVQVAFTPDGRHAYVSLRDENAVAVLDVAARRRIAIIPVGRSPIQLYATPDGRFLYVANQGTEAAPDSTVSVIDVRQNAVVATLITGRGAHDVVVSDDGSRVFVSNTFANTVSVIDVAGQRVIGSVAVGKNPGGITYRSPDRWARVP